MNQIVTRAFADGLQIPSDWEIVHQTGHADVAVIREFYTSANDHQMCNARLLEKDGAAIVIEERHRKADVTTGAALSKLLGSADERQRLSNRIRTFASPNATVETMRLLREVVGENG